MNNSKCLKDCIFLVSVYIGVSVVLEPKRLLGLLSFSQTTGKVDRL